MINTNPRAGNYVDAHRMRSRGTCGSNAEKNCVNFKRRTRRSAMRSRTDSVFFWRVCAPVKIFEYVFFLYEWGWKLGDLRNVGSSKERHLHDYISKKIDSTF